MKVAVLGCSGAMGSFFAKYFLKEGHSVAGFDRRRPVMPRARFMFANSNPEAVRNADIALIAVPMGETLKVVREVSPFLKKGSTIVDISSVKGKIPGELKRFLAGGTSSLLSIHPMFGPSARMENLKICVIGNKHDLTAVRRLFPGSKLILMGAREHDKQMAYALSLVHLVNMAFVSALVKGIGVKEFERVSSPTGLAQLSLSRAVLSQNPSLIAHVQTENPFIADVLRCMIAEFEDVRRLIGRNDIAGFGRKFAALARQFERAELDEALRNVYLSSRL